MAGNKQEKIKEGKEKEVEGALDGQGTFPSKMTFISSPQ